MIQRLTLFLLLFVSLSTRGFPQSKCWIDSESFKMVYDEAGVLDYASEARVQVAVENFNRSHGVVLVVYVAPDLCGWSALGFGTELGSDWGVGDAGLNNGLILVALPKTDGVSGQLALSVGKGLEAKLTDEEAQGIIDDVIPFLKERDWLGGLDEMLNQGLPRALQQ